MDHQIFGQDWSVRSKIWLEFNGKPFMGEGRLAILQAIEEHGSMMEAAKETKISYRRIRGAIKDMENSLGKRLVIVKRGGRGGGGATTTELAQKLILLFKKQQKGMKERVDQVFNLIFK